ncbi:DNA-directed RNA polymerase II subunit GRINL1A-like [Ischnura elegans]|uniref:DNA-directed RNA polymerase II subunit GRINL1A-like n=1 Tax=Ischnura elegans TaxID=197161 RepID=UPI001ED86DA4|nr:DNA-directed RNA polymerase II subunit GRINL1A-like [Ischnura elegans]
MFESKIIKRIPGAPPVTPKEKQGYIEDLGKLSKVQLIELLERQNSLLRNTSFIKRLPDKGDKISTFKCRLESELNRRKEVEKTTELFEKLDINGPVEEIEWTGKYSAGNPNADEGSSREEEDTNVLRILASHGRTSKIERVMKPSEQLITKEDMEEINAVKDPYAIALCSKVAEVNSRPMKEKFVPCRPLKNKGVPPLLQTTSSRNSLSNGKNPEEGGSSVLPRPSSRNSLVNGFNPEAGKVDEAKSEARRMEDGGNNIDDEDRASVTDSVRRVRHWEITAATPPPPVHDQVVLLDLETSIALEKAAVEKTLEARNKQSMTRLAEQLQRGSFTQYRDAKEISSDEEDDDEEEKKKKEEQEECGDEDEEPERDVAIVYSVVDCNDEAS